MENDNHRSSSDLGLSQPLGFQDFDLQENHIWCDQCKSLKQELKKLQDEHALNYSTLKKKIISTDLLIKKYKSKCDDYDVQNKRHEDFFKKYEDLQRESETLNTQLGSTLQQLEPLRKAKTILDADNKQKLQEVQSLRDRQAGLELTLRQYEEMSRETSTYKDRYDVLKKENQKKMQNLETINQKNEALLNKVRDENKNLRSDGSNQLRKQRKLEEKMKRLADRVERYWGILRQNGLLPKGEKKLLTDYGDFSVSQDEEENVDEENKEEEEEDSNESNKFPWIFSPLVQALSPLPPSPMPCRMNKPLICNMESDEENIDDMANILESELLRSSPVWQTSRSQSLLRKVQTLSPLVEIKQKPKNKVSNTSKNDRKIELLKSNSFIKMTEGEGESLSDSDSENVISNEMDVNFTAKQSHDNFKVLSLDSLEKPNEKGDNLEKVLESEKTRSEKSDSKVELSEHSAFKKFNPKTIKDMPIKSKAVKITEPVQKAACLEVYPNEFIPVKPSEDKCVDKISKNKPSLNTSRKIEFAEKPAGDGLKTKNANRLSDKINKSDTNQRTDTGFIDNNSLKEKKDSGDNGFDLDDLVYDNCNLEDNSTREFCETPNLDDLPLVKKKDENIIHQQEKPLCKSDDSQQQSHTENTQKDSLHKKCAKDENRIQTSEKLTRSMIRQESGGFALKSQSSLESENLYSKSSSSQVIQNEISKTGDLYSNENLDAVVKEKIDIEKDQNLKTKDEMTVNKIVQKESAAKHSNRKISHQDSLGFKVDIIDNHVDNSDCNLNTELRTAHAGLEVVNVSEPNVDKEIVSSVICQKNEKSENHILKEKYLKFIESRRSSQDSIAGTEKISADIELKMSSKGDNKNGDKNTERDNYQTNSSEKSKIIDLKEDLPTAKVKKKNKDKKKVIEKNKINAIGQICNSASESSQVNIPTKTLHQLVLHGLNTKTVPSSTVISPDIHDVCFKIESQPKSLHSPLPLSPLTVSPFDFTIPMMISPLPPSPARQSEPVSPLPGSPWIEDDVSETHSNRSTPINVPKKRTKSRPCSFSSSVPIHAIHVKPISACNSASTSTDQTSSAKKPVPAERDPLTLNRKQRISRVPKQGAALKRKSYEPIASEIKDKKKCTKEKKSETQEEKVVLKQETGYWKDVEIYLQQYICLYHMTPEDIKVKLLTDKDPAAVLPAVILWTTQYLRSSEEEMLNSMYRSCKNKEETKPGPFLTTQESRLVDLFVYIIHNNIWVEFKTRLLDALWNCIMLRDVVTILGRTALCRMFTGICQKEGNVDFVRVLFYRIVTSGYPRYITLGLSIIGVWPEVLYKTNTDPSILLTTFEFCIMKILLTDKEKHEKVIVCYSSLCNWSKPQNMEVPAVMRILLQELLKITKQDETDSVISDQQFEVYKSLELLLLTEDSEFFKNSFTPICLNQFFQKIKGNANMNGGFPLMYIKSIVNIAATILGRKMDPKFAAKNTRKFMLGLLLLATVSMEAKELIANALLDIAFIAPMPIFTQLKEWFQKDQKSISSQLKQRIEHTRTVLTSYEGKLSSFSFR
ncbi:putative autophagy-related protein 11 [Mytilus edulis]|uniref:putative autophagy-related protein 11 n=1 Tax=Mytilus edulis TaxID=6550 RepID=UPI0039EF5F9D